MRAKEKLHLPGRKRKACKNLHFMTFHLIFSSHLSQDDTRGAQPSKTELGSIFTSTHQFFGGKLNLNTLGPLTIGITYLQNS